MALYKNLSLGDHKAVDDWVSQFSDNGDGRAPLCVAYWLDEEGVTVFKCVDREATKGKREIVHKIVKFATSTPPVLLPLD